MMAGSKNFLIKLSCNILSFDSGLCVCSSNETKFDDQIKGHSSSQTSDWSGQQNQCHITVYFRSILQYQSNFIDQFFYAA